MMLCKVEEIGLGCHFKQCSGNRRKDKITLG
jgi:hypothetical protein